MTYHHLVPFTPTSIEAIESLGKDVYEAQVLQLVELNLILSFLQECGDELPLPLDHFPSFCAQAYDESKDMLLGPMKSISPIAKRSVASKSFPPSYKSRSPHLPPSSILGPNSLKSSKRGGLMMMIPPSNLDPSKAGS